MARINVEDHKKAIFTLNGIPPFEEEMCSATRFLRNSDRIIEKK